MKKTALFIAWFYGMALQNGLGQNFTDLPCWNRDEIARNNFSVFLPFAPAQEHGASKRNNNPKGKKKTKDAGQKAQAGSPKLMVICCASLASPSFVVIGFASLGHSLSLDLVSAYGRRLVRVMTAQRMTTQ